MYKNFIRDLVLQILNILKHHEQPRRWKRACRIKKRSLIIGEIITGKHSSVLQVWTQLLHYFILLLVKSILLNLSSHTIILPPTVSVNCNKLKSYIFYALGAFRFGSDFGENIKFLISSLMQPTVESNSTVLSFKCE